MHRFHAARGSLVVVAPLLLALSVAFVGLTHPGGSVRGSLSKGPVGVPLPAPPGFHRAYGVHWAHGPERIELTVEQSRSCRPRVTRVTSTGPARVEVEVRASLTPRCLTAPVSWSFLVPAPRVIEPGQAVEVFVNGYRIPLPAYRR
jgi:hypothetical protein